MWDNVSDEACACACACACAFACVLRSRSWSYLQPAQQRLNILRRIEARRHLAIWNRLQDGTRKRSDQTTVPYGLCTDGSLTAVDFFITPPPLVPACCSSTSTFAARLASGEDPDTLRFGGIASHFHTGELLHPTVWER
jgi:hypothetical protein